MREVIGRRLRHLSDECNRLLTFASVLGREFDLDALAGVSGLERGGILELLDEGIEARVVSEVPGAIGRVRFAHALIRDTAYHRLTRSRRVQLHRQVGEALELLYSSDLDAHLAELAHHFFEAAAAGDGQKSVDYARRAGSRSVAVLAYEEAVRLYEMAIEALGPDAAATTPLRCELLLSLADAQGRAGDGPAAKATFLRAAVLARTAELPEMLARAAAGYGGRFLWTHALADERLVPLLEEALSGLGEEHDLLRVQLLSRLAAALRHAPSRTRRERISEEALQIARGSGDPPTLAYALAAAAAALIAPHNAQTRLAEGDEIVAQAAKAGDRERLFDGHEHSYWAAWELGDPDRRAAELASMARVANELTPARPALDTRRSGGHPRALTGPIRRGRGADRTSGDSRQPCPGLECGGDTQAAAVHAAPRTGTTRRLRARDQGQRARVPLTAHVRSRSRSALRRHAANRSGRDPPPRAHASRPLGLARRRGVARQHLPAGRDLRNPR